MVIDDTITTLDGDMPVYVAPSKDARRAVIVIQEAFGVTDHIKAVCDRLAKAGFHAIAPSLYYRHGSPVFGYDDFAAVAPLMNTLDADEISNDVASVLSHLQAGGFVRDRIAMVGFCMGGTVAFHTAVKERLGAAASFYGGGVGEGRFGYPSQIEAAVGLLTPWLGLFGDRDASISVQEVEELRQALSDETVTATVRRFADADHGFHCDERPAVYDPDAAAAAWAEMMEWFDAHLA